MKNMSRKESVAFNYSPSSWQQKIACTGIFPPIMLLISSQNESSVKKKKKKKRIKQMSTGKYSIQI